MVDRIADQAQALWHDGRRPVLQERRLGELELRDRQTEFEPLAVIGETAEPRREVRLDAGRSKERKQTHEHKALKALRLKLSEGHETRGQLGADLDDQRAVKIRVL